MSSPLTSLSSFEDLDDIPSEPLDPYSSIADDSDVLTIAKVILSFDILL